MNMNDKGGTSASEERERACRALEADGIEFALLASPENVTYASGFAVPLHVGPPAAFAGVNPLALALLGVRDRRLRLIVVDFYASKAMEAAGKTNVVSFDSFGHFAPIDPLLSYTETILRALREAGLSGGSRTKLGVEKAMLPAHLAEMIGRAFPHVQLTEVVPQMERARAIKTKRELALLREAARVLDCGHRKLAELAADGGPASEFELWRDIESAVVEAAGGRVTITGELLTGPRIALIAPGGPISREVRSGDAGLLDISPRVNGYWADSSNVVVFGAEPSREQRRYFAAAREAFDVAVDALKPGVRCCDVELAIRRTLEAHGFPLAHYAGHQIGVSVNEWPKLVPYDKTPVQAGMVFAIEPGVYEGDGGGHGARAERMVAVTETGAELLNHFPWGIA